MATRFLKISSNGNKILKSKLITAPSYLIQLFISIFNRLRPIAQRFNLDEEAVLENVFYARAFTSDEQIEMMDHVAALFYQEPGVFKLLIVDSIMALFRVDYSGRGELADRQQHLAQVCTLCASF